MLHAADLPTQRALMHDWPFCGSRLDKPAALLASDLGRHVRWHSSARWDGTRSENRNRHVCDESPSRSGSLSSRYRWFESAANFVFGREALKRSAETTRDDPEGEYLKRNRWFESGSLQQRVRCEPDPRERIPSDDGGRARCAVRPQLPRGGHGRPEGQKDGAGVERPAGPCRPLGLDGQQRHEVTRQATLVEADIVVVVGCGIPIRHPPGAPTCRDKPTPVQARQFGGGLAKS
jgi:hypothetical protein